MLETILLVTAVLGLGILAYAWRRTRARRLARERLAAGSVPAAELHAVSEGQPFLRRHWLLPWLVAVLLFAGLYFLTPLPLSYAAAFGVMLGLLGGQIEAMWATSLGFLIEAQLGEAIDLMVGALRAGGGVVSALESATEEARRPLRPQFEEVLGRIRYGDDAQAALRGLVARVPREAFRLFASALAVHWEVGGSLAPTLATVGRSIRDRTEVARRVQSLTTQARFSVIAVLGVTYFIALIMWRTDPARMREFLTSAVGQGLVVAAMILQAVGIVWTAVLSRLKF